MKKTLSSLLALAMILTMIQVGIISASALQEGDFTYTVSGTNATITAYTGAGGNITIPNTLGGYTVNSIGTSAFAYTAISTVNIPDSVTSISSYAFRDCTSLTSFTFPAGVTSISTYTLLNCTGLTKVIIPNNVTSIGSYSFQSCTSLASIYIPDSVTNIDSNAFRYCSGLLTVTIPNSITTINGSVFFNCTALTNVDIPDTVTSIGSYAFRGCSSLKIVTIPSTVTSIGSSAFAYCSVLVGAYFKGNAPTMATGVFSNCASTFKVYYLSGKTGFTNPWNGYTTQTFSFLYAPYLEASTADPTVDPVTITISYPTNAVNKEYRLATGAWTAYAAPVVVSSATTLYARYKNTSGSISETNSIIISNIAVNDYTYLVEGNSATIMNYIGTGGSITIPSTLNGYIVTGIGDNVFMVNTDLTSVIIPSSVTSIGEAAFANCSNMTSISIGDNVKTIRNAAFFGDSGLTNVTIPKSVESIEPTVFTNCSNPNFSISVSPENNHFYVTDGVLFYHNNITDTITLTACPNNKSGNYVIPSNVDFIGNAAFEKCTLLTSVDMSGCENITSIPYSAFMDCTALTNVIMRNSQNISHINTIGSLAFYCCQSLTSIIIPDTVSSIGGDAFGHCHNLSKVYFLGNAPTLDILTFYDCNCTIYYLSDKSGFTNPWADCPTVVYQYANLVARSGSTTVINQTNHFIYGLQPGITSTIFENSYVQINGNGINGNGRLVYTNVSNSFGTGTKVDLIDNVINQIVATYYIVIFGDVDADGIVSYDDADVVEAVENGVITWNATSQAYNYFAGDVNRDDNIDSTDAEIIRNIADGLMGVNQVTGMYYDI